MEAAGRAARPRAAVVAMANAAAQVAQERMEETDSTSRQGWGGGDVQAWAFPTYFAC